ncbi:MAG TPA: metallophosphoesterase [Candidatus Aphodocola excrementigallinarum]|uniref:Metallophosphoesterase n=1 Tax=Candidatus Aphodocola excrementigallinarum TaxID=2840670 RepID=A0A9D1LI96_9FIRM|nr:metallophosphoesterase [Candidatus Aphodocola excrementigallinarum]
MATSDLHIGNVKSDEEAIDTIYNYCIKNKIHVIVNCGDIVDGTFSKKGCFLPPEEQVEYLIKNYPFDKSIFNLYTLGGHDASLCTLKNLSITAA